MNSKISMLSWNVNGMRAILKKNFYEFVREHSPDILCLQETRMGSEEVPIELPEHKHYWNGAVKLGYSGTAVFTRFEPLNVTKGIGVDVHDQEGRVLTLEFKNFFLVNVYTPNAQPSLKRIAYRQEWESEFLKYLKKLEEKKPIIVCGDLNVAHTEIDLARPKENVGNPGFSDQERECFGNLIKADLLDTFREFEKGPGHYTWWSYRTNARGRNIGWRIDYFLISKILRPKLLSAQIFPQILGSDHCPVGVEFHSDLI